MIFLIALGWVELVGVEYDLQKRGIQKNIGNIADDINVRPNNRLLFNDVRGIHFSYLRYLYFNIGRIAGLQANVLSAYVF